jgi:hypothetical protein
MRKALTYWFTLLAVLLFMTSCKSKQVIATDITKDSIVITAKDTTFVVSKDSSSYVADLVTDSVGKISIKDVVSIVPGRKLHVPKVTIKNNKIQVDCYAEAEFMFASWKETFIKHYREKQLPVITNELNWWQKTQIYIGRTALALLLLWLLILLRKFKK